MQENITVCGKQGGKLEGNSSIKFLKSLDSLEFKHWYVLTRGLFHRSTFY